LVFPILDDTLKTAIQLARRLVVWDGRRNEWARLTTRDRSSAQCLGDVAGKQDLEFPLE
jgi:hypothetical protein